MFDNNTIKNTIQLYDMVCNLIDSNPLEEKSINQIINLDKYTNDVMEIILEQDKIKLFVESLNITFEDKYFRALFNNSTQEELEKIFNICCYTREKELINILMKEHEIKPKQEQLELYLDNACDDIIEILEFCLLNGLKLNNMQLYELVRIKNNDIDCILRNYGYVF